MNSVRSSTGTSCGIQQIELRCGDAMLHDIFWFWSTGRHDPTWVQAATSLCLVFLSILTLAALVWYACDNHRLAENNLETLRFLKEQEDRGITADYAAAFDVFLLVQGKLTSLVRSLNTDRFSRFQPHPLFPPNWPQLTVAVSLKAQSATHAWVKLGNALRKLDFEITDYFAAESVNEKEEIYGGLRKALQSAFDHTMELAQVLPGYSEKLKRTP
jgi:hypothetical protein